MGPVMPKWMPTVIVIVVLVLFLALIGSLVVQVEIGSSPKVAEHQGPVLHSQTGVQGSEVEVQHLLQWNQLSRGLSRVRVDGRTFLIWRSSQGVFIEEYVPLEPEGGL